MVLMVPGSLLSYECSLKVYLWPRRMFVIVSTSLLVILYSAHTLGSHLITGFQLELAFIFLMLLWWKSHLNPHAWRPNQSVQHSAMRHDNERLWGRERGRGYHWTSPDLVARQRLWSCAEEERVITFVCPIVLRQKPKDWMEGRDGRRHCCGGRERGREWLKEPGFLLSFLKSAVQEERRLKQSLLLKLDCIKEALHIFIHLCTCAATLFLYCHAKWEDRNAFVRLLNILTRLRPDWVDCYSACGHLVPGSSQIHQSLQSPLSIKEMGITSVNVCSVRQKKEN